LKFVVKLAKYIWEAALEKMALKRKTWGQVSRICRLVERQVGAGSANRTMCSTQRSGTWLGSGKRLF
jgi:hypothetical protein